MTLQSPAPRPIPYANPVYARDFADIGVLRRPEGYYAYASQGLTPAGMQNIQCSFSPDLVGWRPLPDALPAKAAWAPAQDYWAPDVVELAGGDFRMFFNAQVEGSGQGIGVARASAPGGPFEVVGGPLVHGPSYRNIDAKAFQSPLDQRWYLIWGSCYAPIVIQELRPDLLGFRDPASPPADLLAPDPAIPATALYEAAWMTARFDPQLRRLFFYLFTSGPDAFGDEGYTVQVARSEAGPTAGFVTLAAATGRPDSVIYRRSAAFVNPGASAVAADASGQEWLISHATLRADVPGYEAARQSPAALWQILRHTRRVMIIDPIAYRDGWPYIPGGAPSLGRADGPLHRAF